MTRVFAGGWDRAAHVLPKRNFGCGRGAVRCNAFEARGVLGRLARVCRKAARGPERGSWYVKEAWSDRGGRLYTTTLSILTLEVYYRYLPMYRKAFIDEAP